MESISKSAAECLMRRNCARCSTGSSFRPSRVGTSRCSSDAPARPRGEPAGPGQWRYSLKVIRRFSRSAKGPDKGRELLQSLKLLIVICSQVLNLLNRGTGVLACRPCGAVFPGCRLDRLESRSHRRATIYSRALSQLRLPAYLSPRDHPDLLRISACIKRLHRKGIDVAPDSEQRLRVART